MYQTANFVLSMSSQTILTFQSAWLLDPQQNSDTIHPHHEETINGSKQGLREHYKRDYIFILEMPEKLNLILCFFSMKYFKHTTDCLILTNTVKVIRNSVPKAEFPHIQFLEYLARHK